MAKNYELTIIIPVYNEQENIFCVKDAFVNYQKVSSIDFKVLFINDGSTDKSLAYIKEVCSINECFDYISFTKNEGLSAAIKAGFDAAKTPWVGYIDADLQTHPEDFELLLAHRKEYDLITGVRTGRKDSALKNLSSKIANGIRRAFTHDGMDDTGCPLKIIKTDIAQKIPMFKGLHRFLPAMVLLQNAKVLQVPVRHYERINGKSKFGLHNRLIGPLLDCFAYLWMKKKYINYSLEPKA